MAFLRLPAFFLLHLLQTTGGPHDVSPLGCLTSLTTLQWLEALLRLASDPLLNTVVKVSEHFGPLAEANGVELRLCGRKV